jgi:hypothetical protein
MVTITLGQRLGKLLFLRQTVIMRKRTVRKVELFLHILTACLLLLKGYLQMSKHLYFPGLIILALGICVLTISLLWKVFRITPKEARVACYYIEAPALMIISYMLHLEDKEFAPYLFLIAGLLYPVAGFISSKRFKKLRKPHQR